MAGPELTSSEIYLEISILRMVNDDLEIGYAYPDRATATPKEIAEAEKELIAIRNLESKGLIRYSHDDSRGTPRRLAQPGLPRSAAYYRRDVYEVTPLGLDLLSKMRLAGAYVVDGPVSRYFP